MNMQVRPIMEFIGAEIVGVDLSKPLDEPTKSRLYGYFADRAVLVFRDQEFDPPRFAAACAVEIFTCPRRADASTPLRSSAVRAFFARQSRTRLGSGPTPPATALGSGRSLEFLKLGLLVPFGFFQKLSRAVVAFAASARK